MEQLSATINAYGDQLIRYINPAIEDPKTLLTADWPLAHFDHAVYTVVVYLLFVLVGSFIMKRVSGPLTFMKHVQYIYNPVQVILCSWMMIEAARQIMSQPNWKILGNKHDLQRSPSSVSKRTNRTG